MKILKTILFVLFALLLIHSGLNKFFNYIPIPDDLPEEVMKDNAAMLEIVWLMPLLGFAEILGGLLILLPRTRALGVLVVFPIMVGVFLSHLLVATQGLVMAIFLWLVFIWMIVDYWPNFTGILAPRPAEPNTPEVQSRD